MKASCVGSSAALALAAIGILPGSAQAGTNEKSGDIAATVVPKDDLVPVSGVGAVKAPVGVSADWLAQNALAPSDPRQAAAAITDQINAVNAMVVPDAPDEQPQDPADDADPGYAGEE